MDMFYEKTGMSGWKRMDYEVDGLRPIGRPKKINQEWLY